MAEMPKMKKVISDGLKAGMARPAARLTDLAGHGGMVAFGTPMVIIGGQIAARMGDPIECKVHGVGNITMGSVTVIIAGACAARMGDPTACCAPGMAGQGCRQLSAVPARSMVLPMKWTVMTTKMVPNGLTKYQAAK